MTQPYYEDDTCTIYHGDATGLLACFPPESVDLILTDPPYGINYISQGHINTSGSSLTRRAGRPEYFTRIVGDGNLPITWLEDAHRLLRVGGAIYVFCHWSRWSRLQAAVEEQRFKVKNMIVLDKSNHGMGDLGGSYAPKHELLLFATKGKHTLRFPNGRTNDVLPVAVNPSFKRRLHPNEKPIQWMNAAIENSCPKNGVVLDPFAGSGSTLHAARTHGCRAIGIEIDERYCEIAAQRLADVPLTLETA